MTTSEDFFAPSTTAVTGGHRWTYAPRGYGWAFGRWECVKGRTFGEHTVMTPAPSPADESALQDSVRGNHTALFGCTDYSTS